MENQPVEPTQLVIELWPRRRVAVRQIDRGDENAVNCRLDVSAMHIVGIAGELARSFDWIGAASEDGDTVPTLLAVPDRSIARFPERRGGELLLRSLQLLQAHNVRFGF